MVDQEIPAPARATAVSVRFLRHRYVHDESRLVTFLWPLAWPVAIYAGSRLVLFVVAVVVAAVTHRGVLYELSLFDGQWYLRLVEHGYPRTPSHTQTTLGFFPLYPLVVKAVSWLSRTSAEAAGLVVSLIGGGVAAVLAERLASSWWGERVGRRAALVFVLFPGSVVFSMTYSECLTVPLAIGCLLALNSKRWALAGLLAGLAGAVEPAALILVPVTLVAAVLHLRKTGWREHAAWRSLAAPLLSVAGVGAFAVFLWVWTGTPFAALDAQHYGWYQQTEPLGIFELPIVRHLLAHPRNVVGYLPSWNLWNGILGGCYFVFALVALVRTRREFSPVVLVLGFGVGLVTLWSVMTPPNVRMALVAFPMVIIWARRLRGSKFIAFLAGETLLFVAMSVLTFSGHMLP